MEPYQEEQHICGNPINDYFAQFYKAWDERSSTNEHYKTWLDPQNTGIQSLEGRNLYDDPVFERLSNIEIGDDPLNSSIQEGGYLAGHNAKPSTKYAEKFFGFESATLNGLYLMSSRYKYGSDQTIDILVWEGNQYPENIKKRQSVKIDTLRANKEIYLKFDQPVEVSGEFFVGYELSYDGSPIDTLAVYYSAGAEKNNNTMYAYDELNGWKKASELYEEDNYTLWVDVLAESVVHLSTKVLNEELTVKVVQKSKNLHVNASSQYIDKYEIIDINGVIVSNGKLNIEGEDANNVIIVLDGIPLGLYIFKLYLNERQITKKIIINRS